MPKEIENEVAVQDLAGLDLNTGLDRHAQLFFSHFKTSPPHCPLYLPGTHATSIGTGKSRRRTGDYRRHRFPHQNGPGRRRGADYEH